MTSIWSFGQPCWEHLSVALPDFFLSLKLRDKLFDQPVGLLGANFLVFVVPTAALAVFAIPKYTNKDLQ